MCTDIPRWHYDYTRIAWDTGFCFDSYKSQKVFDRNGIALLDIERIIRERDIAIVDHHIQNILEYKLDIEETRILDPNFVKLFRLSQLAVEYLTYCKKYLDTTIVVIKQDLQKSTEENSVLKRDIINYQSEIHKLKKKIKDLKSTLLIHQKYHPVGCVSEGVATFQCNECSKLFVNDEYLKAHVTRRHSNNEVQQLESKLAENRADSKSSPVHTQYKIETDRLQMEIKELKEKLNSRERYFKNEEQNMKTNNDGAMSTTQSEEYYKRMETLHQEFELFKTQYESEMQVIRKGEQEKYDKWMAKIFDKLDSNSTQIQKIEDENKKVSNKNIDEANLQNKATNMISVPKEDLNNVNDLKQTNKEKNADKIEKEIDDKTIAEETNEDISSEAGEIRSPEKQVQEIYEIDDTSTESKIIQKQIDSIVPDISKVKEEVGKELEEKTKQDIEKLGEQLSEQMSDTFCKLQSRMETFWNKLQEIEVQRDVQQTQLVTNIQNTPQTVPVPKIRAEIPQNVSKQAVENSSSQYSDSNSEESETETSRHYEKHTVEVHKPRPTMIPIHANDKITRNLMVELKTKVQEKKKTTDTKLKSNVAPTKPVLQKPNVQKIFSKPIVERVESSSESESDSETDDSETESDSVVVRQVRHVTEPSLSQKPQTVTDGGRSRVPEKTTRSQDKVPVPKPEILQTFRKQIEDEFVERQRDLGLDPEWTRLPDRTYKHKSDILEHQRMLIAKDIPSFNDIREKIITKLDSKLNDSNLSDSACITPESDMIKPSRFKSLFINMKNKAKSMIRSDKSPTPSTTTTTGIYKLTIHRDSPEPEEKYIDIPKPAPRSRVVTNKNKRTTDSKMVSPRTNTNEKRSMYESDSENYTESLSDQRKLSRKVRSVQSQRKVLRKTKSESSMDTEISEQQTRKSPVLTTMARSLSNLDSILEIKKEISNQSLSEGSQYSSEDIREHTEVIAVSPREQMAKSSDSILKAIENEKVQLENISSDLDSEDLKEKAHKSALKNYPSTVALVKKKVLFDLQTEDQNVQLETSRSTEQNPEKQSAERKQVIRSNSLFQTDGMNGGNDSSTSIDSSILDFNKKKPKKSMKGSGDTISTKALINVSSKAQEDGSDWDISDIVK